MNNTRDLTDSDFSLNESSDCSATLDLSDMSSQSYDMSYDNITYSYSGAGGMADTITINPPTPTITISNLNSNAILTSGTSGPSWNTISGINPMSVDQTGTIELRGENADIKVNGESMMQTLRAIQDRLNMLRPNTALESEWDQLRELGEQYRKLETEFKEKSKMWNTLQSMPAPKIK